MSSTGVVASRHDYQPFGGEIGGGVGSRVNDSLYGQADSARQKYAGMETDDGSNNSHTLWRKYDSSSGRWTTTDPYGGSMNVADPQSFNRYTYVNNDPVNRQDPTGLIYRVSAEHGWQYMSDFWYGGGEWRKRSFWHSLSGQGRSRKGKESKKKKPSKPAPDQAAPPQPQVVDLRKDKIITEELAKLKADAKPLAKGDTPILTSVASILGETYNLENGTVIDAYGNEVTNFTGTVRPVAYAPLDQGGNIIGNGIKVTEYVFTKSGEDPNTTPDVPPTKDGVYIDMQMVPKGTPVTTLTQKVYVDHYIGGHRMRSFVCESQIIKNAAAKTIVVDRQVPRPSPF